MVVSKEGKKMASPRATISQNHLPASLLGFSWNCPRIRGSYNAPAAALEPLALPLVENRTAAREQILLAHLPLVRYVALRIRERLPHYVEMEDLVSAGIVGLIDAYEKFDAAKNVQFRSYAQFRIRGAILDSLRGLDWGPRELRRKAREIEAAVQQVTQRIGERPQENQIADELGMPLQEYQRLIYELHNLETSSLHELRGEDSAEEELAFVPAAPEEDPFFRCMQQEQTRRLVEAVRELPPRPAQVLSLYYVEGMTLREIGAAIGLAESRVSQIRSAAIHQLRTRLTRENRTGTRRRARIPEVMLACRN